MWFLALVVGVLLLSLLRLTTRYEYGPRSVRSLKLVFAASLAVSLLLVRYVLWPGLETLYMLLVATAISIPLFTLAAAITVEILRKQKQAVYDQRLRELKARAQDLLAEVEDATRKIRSELRLQEEAEAASRDREQSTSAHRRRVETWKHEGGAARIRSLKLEEWERDLGALDAAGLEERRQVLERELETAGPERRAQVEVQIALSFLVGEGEEDGEHGVVGRRLERGSAELVEQRRGSEIALRAVQEDLAVAQRRLSEFLSKEIRLD